MRRVLFSRLDRDIFLFDHPFSTYVPVEEEAVLEKHTFTYEARFLFRVYTKIKIF